MKRSLSGFKAALWSLSQKGCHESQARHSLLELVDMQSGKLWQYIVIVVGVAAIAYVIYKIASGGLG